VDMATAAMSEAILVVIIVIVVVIAAVSVIQTSVGQSLASETHLFDFRYRARDRESKSEAINRS
jgi:flagellar basal body-associated protein FliL